MVYLAIGVGMSSLYMLTEGVPFAHTIVKHWYRYDSIFVLVMSLALLMFFHNLTLTNRKIVRVTTLIAPATFGVYLIHAHADVSPWLWETMDLPSHMNSCLFPLVQAIIVLSIFVICVLVDIFRKNTLGRIENGKLSDETSNLIMKNVVHIINMLFED